jgi:hypothetical protein
VAIVAALETALAAPLFSLADTEVNKNEWLPVDPGWQPVGSSCVHLFK